MSKPAVIKKHLRHVVMIILSTIFVSASTCFCITLHQQYARQRTLPASVHSVQNRSSIADESFRTLLQQKIEFERQRNDVSFRLNRLQEKHQQLICESQHEKDTSETGGWCDESLMEHVIDKSLVNGLEMLLANKTVVGLGDGIGGYRRHLLASGRVKKYDAFDGSPNIYYRTGGQVDFADLTLPQYWLPTYDWVVIIEVIEHIPAQYEDIVLDNVARVAGSGVVLSWAIPGQSGHHHVNNQPFEHVIEVMKRRGFVQDGVWSLKLRQSAVMPWLKTNILVFRRVDNEDKF